MIYELFSNIALASFMTTSIIVIFGFSIRLYNDKCIVANILLWVAVIFAVVAGLSFIISFWLFTVFKGI